MYVYSVYTMAKTYGAKAREVRIYTFNLDGIRETTFYTLVFVFFALDTVC